ncbi:glycosyltransferase [Candidatus Sumerlaeota bacterium]|nr:glycosyltransferase [Candidatus Sumerlaeota bacterium]
MDADTQYFDQPEIWGQAPEPYQRQVLADVLSLLPDDVESVLDAGCGDGYIANALPERLRVVGLDVSETALQHVRRETRVGSIADLPFPDGSFDLAMANDVVEHLSKEDYRRALAELRRVSRKYILLTVPLNEQLEANEARCADCGAIYHVNHHRRSFSERSLDRLFGARFKVVETRLSGDVTGRPRDPTAALRRNLGFYHTWEKAMCPECGSKRQIQPPTSSTLRRTLDALRTRRYAETLVQRGPWNDRSEIVALFSRRPGRVPLEDLSPETFSVPALRVNLANALQRAEPGFTPGAIRPRFLTRGPWEATPNGLQARTGDEPSLVLIRFPVEPREGDRLIVESEGRGRLIVSSLDPLLGRAFALQDKRYTQEDARFLEIPVCETWWPDQAGWGLEIVAQDALVLHSVELRPASDAARRTLNAVRLEPGHHIVRRTIDGVVRSWGLMTEHAGWRPLPDLEAFFSKSRPKPESHDADWAEFAETIREADDRRRREIDLLRRGSELTETKRARAEEAYSQAQERASAVETARDEMQALRTQVETLRAALTRTEEARDRAEKSYIAACEEHRALSAETESLRKTLAQTEEGWSRAEKTYIAACEEHQALCAETQSLRDGLARTEEARNRAEKSYIAACEEHQAMRRGTESLRNALTEAENALRRAQEDHETDLKEKERLRDEARELRTALSQAQETRRRAEESCAALRDEKNALHDQLANVRDALVQVEQARDRAENARVALSEERLALRVDMDALRRSLAQTEKERLRIESASAALERRVMKLEQALTDAEQEIATSKQEVASLHDETVRAEVEIDKTRRQRDKAENACVVLRKSHEDLEKRLAALTEECRSMRGVRGGTREILYAVKKWIVGHPPDSPDETYPARWKSLPAALADGRSPRVLVLSHMFPHPDQPALGSFILEQVRALRRDAGVDARVLSGRPYWMNLSRHPRTLWLRNLDYSRKALPNVRWRELDGVPVMYVPYRVVARPWTHGWSYRNAMMRVLDRVRAEFRFDLVHAHTAYLDGTAGLAIARRFGVPFLITEHTGPFSHLLRGPIMTRQTKRALNGADRTIAVSNDLKRNMGEVMSPEKGEKIVVLPNGVDTELFRLPDEHRPDPRAPRIFFVGGLGPVKNLRLLLRAFQIIAGETPDATLNLIGGEEKAGKKKVLDDLAGELGLVNQVRFLGPKTREEVAELLREEADLLVLSSRTETFGCVLVEAMACGKPVVATRCGGPEDIVADNQVGRLCENDNVEDLARALRETIENLPRFSPQVIRQFAVERYGYDALTENLRRLYAELAGAGNGLRRT